MSQESNFDPSTEKSLLLLAEAVGLIGPSSRVGDSHNATIRFGKAEPVLVPEDVRAHEAKGWRDAATWLCNNYQDHPNIASLCEAMCEAGAKA